MIQKLSGWSRNCLDNPETVRIIQKLSGQSINCPDNPETVRIIQKLSGWSRNCLDNPETVRIIQKLSGQSINCPDKSRGISVKKIVTSCTQSQIKRFSYSFFPKGIFCGRNEKEYQWNLQTVLPRCAPQVLSISRAGPGRGKAFFCGARQPVFLRGGRASLIYRPLRPKSAIPHPITIQNMRFER